MFRLRHKLWLIVILFFSFPWFWNCFFGFSLVNSIANKLNHKLRLLKRRCCSLGHVYSSIDCSLGLAIAFIYYDHLRANFVIKRHNESNPKCYLSSCIVRTIVIFVRTASNHHLEKYYTLWPTTVCGDSNRIAPLRNLKYLKPGLRCMVLSFRSWSANFLTTMLC